MQRLTRKWMDEETFNFSVCAEKDGGLDVPSTVDAFPFGMCARLSVLSQAFTYLALTRTDPMEHPCASKSIFQRFEFRCAPGRIRLDD